MQDRPTAVELLRVVREFLERELTPSVTDGRLRYQLLIATNVLQLIERELPVEESGLRAELQALQELLDLPRTPSPADLEQLRREVWDANQELCERIRRGVADTGPWREQVYAHLWATVEEKLRINNPAQLEALRAARATEDAG